MYIRKVEGPRTVTLPGGEVVTRADLPDPGTRRWVASRKAAVLRAITAGLISHSEACDMYDLSDEELESWARAVHRHGEGALKTTRLQEYRQL